MNVIGHEHLSPDADSKISCTLAISDNSFVYFVPREQARASVRIECYEIEWRIGTLEDQIQSWRLILEHSLHETCLARSAFRSNEKLR
jgi:hypothetical protein